jgi:cytochrome c551/c552
MKNNKRLFGLLFILSLATLGHANPVEEGKTIFLSRCAACHNVNKAMTGPALAGVDQRRSLEWITKFVHSSQSLIKSGDKDATALYEQFNRVPMPDHPDLTSENIKNIMEYIKSEAKPTDENKGPFAKPGKLTTPYKPLNLQKNYLFFIVYLAAVTMLISILLFAVKVKAVQRDKAVANATNK